MSTAHHSSQADIATVPRPVFHPGWQQSRVVTAPPPVPLAIPAPVKSALCDDAALEMARAEVSGQPLYQETIIMLRHSKSGLRLSFQITTGTLIMLVVGGLLLLAAFDLFSVVAHSLLSAH